MRGNGFGHIVASNIAALTARQRNERRMNKKLKMCWKCQKDKNPYGGYLRIAAGLHKFICEECMDAKQKQLEESKHDATVSTVPEPEGQGKQISEVQP
jgi:hypothetical protein